jgi:hypothetical protein
MKMGITVHGINRGQIPHPMQCPYSAPTDEDGHHVVQNQKRSNTSISTKREAVLADRALSSPIWYQVITTSDDGVKYWKPVQVFQPKCLFLIPNSDLNVPFCNKSSREQDCSNQTASIQLKPFQIQK